MKNNPLLKVLICAVVLSATSFAWAQTPIPLDAASAECVGCHEDAVTVKEPLQVCHQGNCDHPVGASYASFSSRNRGLVAPENLIPGIKLVDGKIGCLTCHTPYTAEHEEQAALRGSSQPDPMLSVDNTGSGLCAACHRK